MKILKRLFWFTTISILFLAGDLNESTHNGFSMIQTAEAVITPGSVAVVKRRTRRRTAVATTAFVRRRPVAAPVVAVPAGGC